MKSSWVTVAVALLLGNACAADAGDEAVRSYSLGLRVDDSTDRYRYVATDAVDIKVGDEVTFEFQNTGILAHDLQVVDPGGTTLGTANPVAPGAGAEVTVRFTEVGFHRLNCLVDDHLTAHEMQTLFEVTEPSG